MRHLTLCSLLTLLGCTADLVGNGTSGLGHEDGRDPASVDPARTDDADRAIARTDGDGRAASSDEDASADRRRPGDEPTDPCDGTVDTECRPDGACDEPDPSAQSCAVDSDCRPGFACLPPVLTVCLPSACVCTDTGWACTDDCAWQCQPIAECDESSNPSLGSCYVDDDCAEGSYCGEPASGECLPSSCVCTDTGWACTDDCANRCQPCTTADEVRCHREPPPTCDEALNPSRKSCSVDSDCTDAEEACLPPASPSECLPSVCVCTDTGWACTDDCAWQCRVPDGSAGDESGADAAR